jgi:hypothetical protein
MPINPIRHNGADTREFRLTVPHAEAHLTAKGYVEKVEAHETLFYDAVGDRAWMRVFVRPSDNRKAFLWVFDPAEAFILVRIGRDGEGL